MLSSQFVEGAPAGVPEFDDDRPHEECGIFGLYLPQDQEAASLIYFALFNLQHRGQDASGIATTESHKKGRRKNILVRKNVGLVAQVHTPPRLRKLKGNIGIGHNRYTTSQANKPEYAQPLLEGNGKLAFALNGNISNTEPMKQFLIEKGIDINGKNDTMLMSVLLWYFLQQTNEIVSAIESCWQYWIGAFSLVILWHDQLVGVRGPYGVRPLVLGEMRGGVALSSESCAWNSIGSLTRPVQPGEVVVITKDGIESHIVEETPEKLDAFEAVYFARPDSVLTFRLPDGSVVEKSVYQIRRNFGRELWEQLGLTADMIVPVPDSSNQTAEEYSQASGVPYRAALIKSRYITRTFIQGTQEERKIAQSFKLNVVEDQVRGKHIILIDDSIVRGTTLTPLIKKLKDAGALSVKVIIASPPVKYPDFYGIATHSQSELIASHSSPEEIAASIGADGVYYLDFERMIRGIGVPKVSLMTSAFTGEYPIDIGEHAQDIVWQT